MTDREYINTDNLDINKLSFCILCEYDPDEVFYTDNTNEEYDDERNKLMNQLQMPSNLGKVYIFKHKKQYEEVDFTGTSNEEAIKKIQEFYRKNCMNVPLNDSLNCEGIRLFKTKNTGDRIYCKLTLRKLEL
jgi:hypothetical protein